MNPSAGLGGDRHRAISRPPDDDRFRHFVGVNDVKINTAAYNIPIPRGLVSTIVPR